MSAKLNDADFTDADIRGTNFDDKCGFTFAQLQSTVSFKTKDLSGTGFWSMDLSGWDFHQQKLTGTDFLWTTLTNTDFTDADIRGSYFSGVKSFTQSQFQSTASYKSKDLAGVALIDIDFTGWDFHGQNLTGASIYNCRLSNANFTQTNLTNASIGPSILHDTNFTQANLTHADLFHADLSQAILTGANLSHASLINANFESATLTGADFSGADMRGAINIDLNAIMGKNIIHPDGSIHSLNLSDGSSLSINAYADASYDYKVPFPIVVKDSLKMGADGLMQIVLNSNYDWNSTISFDPGIPVSLGGTLELAFNYMDDGYAAYLVGKEFKIFDWSGVNPTGAFKVESEYAWDLSHLYTTGFVTFLAVPEPTIFGILIIGLLTFAVRSLIKRHKRRRS